VVEKLKEVNCVFVGYFHCGAKVYKVETVTYEVLREKVRVKGA